MICANYKLLRATAATIKIEYKYRADKREPFFLGCHSRELFTRPKGECLGLYVGVSEWWGNYKLCRALGVQMSPIFSYLGIEFVDGREPTLSMIRRHRYCEACVNHYVAVLMAFLADVFTLQELAIHDLPGPDARMRVGACKGILFPLLQYVRDLIRDIYVQDLVYGTQFHLGFFHWPYGVWVN